MIKKLNCIYSPLPLAPNPVTVPFTVDVVESTNAIFKDPLSEDDEFAVATFEKAAFQDEVPEEAKCEVTFVELSTNKIIN